MTLKKGNALAATQSAPKTKRPSFYSLGGKYYRFRQESGIANSGYRGGGEKSEPREAIAETAAKKRQKAQRREAATRARIRQKNGGKKIYKPRIMGNRRISREKAQNSKEKTPDVLSGKSSSQPANDLDYCSAEERSRNQERRSADSLVCEFLIRGCELADNTLFVTAL
jgi:hypothetical protein